MGQTTRILKYNKFWLWVDNTVEARGDAIDMLLRTLIDEQLDQLLAEIAEAGGFGDDEDEND